MTRSAGFIVVFMAYALPAFAHHGAGTFDLTKSVTFTGKLTKIEMINPHSWLYFDVTDANGRVSPSLRDAIGARVAPVGLDEGAVSSRTGDHRGGGA